MRQNWPERLWIVRHGESAGNIARDAAQASGLARIDLAQRDADVPLSARGEQQAEALGLPTAPPKPTDRRRFPGDTEQCEAIAPDVLALEADMRAALVEKLGGAQ